jgi:heat shock protein HslJ/phosphoserine phosphatase
LKADREEEMLTMNSLVRIVVAGLLSVLSLPGFLGSYGPAASARAADPLPSWNEGAAKQALLDFVARVVNPSSDGYVPPDQRIATFDNDGTLWVEKPVYTQLTFTFDRVVELAPSHPEWKTKQPFQALLAGDKQQVAASGIPGLLALAGATHAGLTVEAFESLVTNWLATARHPRFKRPFTELVYQPQLELLDYLRAHDFKTYIVSGGGIEFMRPWTEKVYGIPPEQVIGSSIVTEYQFQDGKPVLMRLPKINFVDDKAGKPVAIRHHIGRRPILALGNSDGDLEMVQWTTAGSGSRLGLFVHHTDAQREYAYDRTSHVGKLDKVLDLIQGRGTNENDWIMVDMKQDWKRIFPWESLETGPTNTLQGTWTLIQLEGDTLPDGAKPPEITFAANGAVSGFTGVNRFTGKFTPQGETLFGPGMATTRMAGAPTAMKLEAEFLSAMRDVNQFKVKRDRLTFSADDLPLMIFERVKTD